MAATYELIASNTLTTSAASVTFSAIPATYTDLTIKISARRAASGRSDIDMSFNTDTTEHSRTHLQGNGSTASSAAGSGRIRIVNVLTGETETADSFNNLEVYIPNYLSSTSKPVSAFGAHEVNNATAFLVAVAGLWHLSPAEAITSVVFQPASGSFKTGSSFFLYGIKNS